VFVVFVVIESQQSVELFEKLPMADHPGIEIVSRVRFQSPVDKDEQAELAAAVGMVGKPEPPDLQGIDHRDENEQFGGYAVADCTGTHISQALIAAERVVGFFLATPLGYHVPDIRLFFIQLFAEEKTSVVCGPGRGGHIGDVLVGGYRPGQHRVEAGEARSALVPEGA